MAFDGIVTQKIAQELIPLIGYKIDKVSQPNKNTVILGLYKNGSNLSLLSCISSNNYRLHLTTHEFKNPTIAPNFCMLLRKHLIGFKIKNIYTTQNLERIIFIDFENSENPDKPIIKKLIIELMGKHSNIILTDTNNIIIDSLRHTSTEEKSQRDIYPTSRYAFPKTTKYNLFDINNPDQFFNIIQPLIASNILSDIENMNTLDIHHFNLDKAICHYFNGLSNSFMQNIIDDIDTISKDNIFLIYNKIFEILNSDSDKLSFIKISDKLKNSKDYVITLDISDKNHPFKLNFFLDDFYFEKETFESFTSYKNNISNIIFNTLKKYNKRLKNIDKKLLECNNMDKFRLYGELITSNLYRISDKNIDSITVENYYDGNSLVNIPLDVRYSPNYNAKQYFKKYSKLKNALDVLNIQKQETLNDLNYIESVVFELENCSTLNDLILINDEISESDNNLFMHSNKKSRKNNFSKTKYNNKNHSKSHPSYFNPLIFTIEDYKVYVGRNNRENDYLTTKFADKNDVWFHTKDTPGSHVILKTHPNEIVPDDVLFEVAKLAASHSKAKDSSSVLVDYCLVRFVKKPINSKPGFVIYKNNKTIKINLGTVP